MKTILPFLLCALAVFHFPAQAAPPDWRFENNLAGSQLGWSVSDAGDVDKDGFGDVVSGAWQAFQNAGEVYLNRGSALGLSTASAWKARGDSAGARFGTSLASGDFNADGYGDVVVGASGHKGRGGVFVYYGSASGLAAVAGWQVIGEKAGSQMGWSVSNAGDVNGDAIDDLIASAVSFTGARNQEGRVYLFPGSKGGLADSAKWTYVGGQNSASFGRSISTAGDVNKDGFADILVGANGITGGGAAYVFYGGATGLAASPAWTGKSEQAGSQYGWYVSEAGDVNGDGFSDILVGAYAYADGQASEGKTYLYSGSDSGPARTASWTFASNKANALYGVSLSSAGDMNRDGYGDFAVTAEGLANGQANEGAVYIHFGSKQGPSAAADSVHESDLANAYLGANVSQAGDVNGDKAGDLIVGAYRLSNGQSEEGAAVAYYGKAKALSGHPATHRPSIPALRALARGAHWEIDLPPSRNSSRVLSLLQPDGSLVYRSDLDAGISSIAVPRPPQPGVFVLQLHLPDGTISVPLVNPGVN